MKGTLLITILVMPLFCSAISPDVRISQIYGGGGNTGSTYQNDFIELYNASSSAVSISGWSVQYAPSASIYWTAISLTGSVASGSYYLIQVSGGGGGTIALPAPDLISNALNMSATAGKVALVNNTTTLTGTCPTGISIIDFVGYGTTANCYEGSGPAPAPSNTESILRGANGCTDTDNNAMDFTKGTPMPRNSSSPSSTCLSAGINAVNESLFHIRNNRNKIDINFYERVDATIEVRNMLGQLLALEKFSGYQYIKEIQNLPGQVLIIIVRVGDRAIVQKLLLSE